MVHGGDPGDAAVMTYIRPTPVFDTDRLLGFTVYPGERTAEFSKLGLQPGDIMTAINGLAVTDGEQIMNALEQVISGSSVQATIQRGGEARSITLDGSVVTAERPNPTQGGLARD